MFIYNKKVISLIPYVVFEISFLLVCKQDEVVVGFYELKSLV